MTAGTPFERLVEDWLAEAGSASIPQGLHGQVVDAARRTSQRRPTPTLESARRVLGPARLAIDLAAVVVLAVAALNAMALWSPSGGGAAIPSASVEPSALSRPSPTPRPRPSDGPADDPEVHPDSADYRLGQHFLTVDGTTFSFTIDAPYWEPWEGFSISKSITGPQGAEAVIFWSAFPDGEKASSCLGLNRPIGDSPLAIAEALATEPGTELVSPPTQTTVGGRPAVYAAVTVREPVGCDPGFVYSWKAKTGGALWVGTEPGDTIQAWIVEVDGQRLFIGALTSGTTPPAVMPELTAQIDAIVASITFE